VSATSPLPRLTAVPKALLRLSSQSQRQLLGLRLGRLYAFGVGLSYALVVFAGPAEAPVAAALWSRCLGTASWVAGVGALSLANDLAARDAVQGLSSLARLRGYAEPQLERARLFAGALRLGATVLVPAILVSLAIVLHLRTLAGTVAALSLLLVSVPYAALVGGVLAPLARLSHRLLPGRGRWVLLALVLGPWLLALGTGTSIPSIPGAFAWVLSRAAGSVG
jgi:hypothetical protein